MLKRKILYIEDTEADYNYLDLVCSKLDIDLHWLPNVPSLEIAPKRMLDKFDFILVDCYGTTTDQSGWLPADFKMEGYKVYAVSAVDLKFNDIEMMRKEKLKGFLKDFYA